MKKEEEAGKERRESEGRWGEQGAWLLGGGGAMCCLSRRVTVPGGDVSGEWPEQLTSRVQVCHGLSRLVMRAVK